MIMSFPFRIELNDYVFPLWSEARSNKLACALVLDSQLFSLNVLDFFRCFFSALHIHPPLSDWSDRSVVECQVGP